MDDRPQAHHMTIAPKKAQSKPLRDGVWFSYSSNRRISGQDLLRLLVACALPAHVWTYLNAFADISSLRLFMSPADLVGFAGYTLTFLLVETIVVFLVLLGIWLLVRKRLPCEVFAPIAGLVLIEYVTYLAFLYNVLPRNSFGEHLVTPSLIALLSLVVATMLFVPRSSKVLAIVNAGIERLEVLVSGYLMIDIIGLAVVIIRNLRL